jgi:hypothetical protein
VDDPEGPFEDNPCIETRDDDRKDRLQSLLLPCSFEVPYVHEQPGRDFR